MPGCKQIAPQVEENVFRAESFHEYRVFTWNEALVPDFVTERPSVEDDAVYFCIAAAFTRAGDYEVDGAYAVNGAWNHTDAINTRLGSALLIESDGTLGFRDTQNGAAITPEMQADIRARSADFFQQLSLVMEGKAQGFTDKALFVRRAIVEKKDGTYAVVESMKHASLSQFAKDLVEFGAQHAIYTDMGSFDEGWYRYAGSPISLGRSKSQTELQTNWFILRAP